MSMWESLFHVSVGKSVSMSVSKNLFLCLCQSQFPCLCQKAYFCVCLKAFFYVCRKACFHICFRKPVFYLNPDFAQKSKTSSPDFIQKSRISNPDSPKIKTYNKSSHIFILTVKIYLTILYHNLTIIVLYFKF